MIITNPIFDGTAMIGFKHPITNQQFIKTSDFYERQKICNTMYQEKGFNNMDFKNQSWFQISVLLFEHYDLGSWNGILSHLSENQRDLYLQYPISQCIGRHDDEHLKYTQKYGTNNYTGEKTPNQSFCYLSFVAYLAISPYLVYLVKFVYLVYLV